MAIRNSMNHVLETCTPVDVQFSKLYSYDAAEDYDMTGHNVEENLKACDIDTSKLTDVTEMILYAPEDINIGDFFGKAFAESGSEDYFKEASMETMHIGEYNAFVSSFGGTTIDLAEDEYVILCNYGEMEPRYNEGLAEGQTVTIKGKTYHPKYTPAGRRRRQVRNPAVVGRQNRQTRLVEGFCRPAIFQCNPKKTTSMKKILLMCLSLLLFASALVSCEDWTEPESKVFLKGDGHDDAYYAALRKWKAETDYDMAWGWFGGWGANATNLKNSLRGLPDSLYLAAIWGRWRPSVLTDAMKADMEYVQRVKGTKVVCTTITGWVGVDVIGGDYQNNPQKEEYFGWKPEWDTPSGWRAADGTDERAAQEASIRKYARMLADSVYTGGYSGIDLDYEPNVGGAGCKRELSNRDNFYIFVDELGKYLGPKSGTDKLLVIDGEINAVEGRCMPYFDYFIWQAYSTSSDSGLNTYISTVIRNGSGYMEPEELIRKLYTTVNFEQYAAEGGGSYTGGINRLLGQALWKPTWEGKTYRKGGFGSYHIEYEYYLSGKSGFYPWTRQAINAVHRSENEEEVPNE